MGRRSKASRFMPGVYVFPGGRVERVDAEPSGFEETLAPSPAGTDRVTRTRLVRFARTALRETFEETGLLVGAPLGSAGGGVGPGRPAGAEIWRAFARAGLAPAFSALALVARAVTPVASPIRFHTRFFRADGDAARGELAGDGELVDLRWVATEDAGGLPMSTVTALVLQEALAHGATGRSARRPAAFFRWVGDAERPRHAVAQVARRA